MFKINDYIMYSTVGVCKVLDIIDEKSVYNMPSEYYVLQPVYSDGTIIKIPVGNTKIVMRPILSEEAVMSLINDMPEDEDVWIDNDRQRNEKFKSIIKTGKCDEWIKLIKSIYVTKEGKKLLGKKLNQADEEIVKAAEKLLFEEFATVLNISPDEVNDYILNNASKQN